METAKLTVRLPKKDLEFAKKYAQEHHITVTELIDRYLRRLQAKYPRGIHPEVEKISGLVPPEIDAEAMYREDLIKRYR